MEESELLVDYGEYHQMNEKEILIENSVWNLIFTFNSLFLSFSFFVFFPHDSLIRFLLAINIELKAKK